MKRINLIAVSVMAAVTVAAPAWGLAGGVPDHGTSANSNAQSHATPNTTPTTPSQAKAFGLLCQKAGASKKHVAGQKGTPFSQCVTALTKLANGEATNPVEACKEVKASKKHVAGQKGTAFSQCVSAAAKVHAGAHK
jgi:hypothetical protein